MKRSAWFIAVITIISMLVDASCFTANADEQWLWPLNGHYHITSAFGWRTLEGKSDYHAAIDINDMNIAYAPVYASKSGSVSYKWVSGAGNCVFITHSDGYVSRYAHLDSYVDGKPTYVRQGQLIGYVGNSGGNYPYHLDFRISTDGTGSTAINNMPKDRSMHTYNSYTGKTTYELSYIYDTSLYNNGEPTHKHSYDLASETCKSCGEKFTRSYADINKDYKVIKNNVSIKSEPYSDIGEVYTRVGGGTTVQVKRSFKNVYGNTWYEVSYGKYTGYMYSGNLESQSELKINLTDYPKSVKVGSGYGLRGTISSNYNLKQVKGYIKQGDSTVQSSTDSPSGKTMDVRTANLNNSLLFNRLSAGNYKLVVEVTDESGKKISVSKDFSVYAEQTKVGSSLSINLEKYPVTLDQGSSYGLRGSVTSNYNISVVKGYVKNSGGSTVLSSTDKPNSTYMDIRTANLNDKLVFNNLSAGNYTMVVEATDTSGRVMTVKKDFTVKGIGSSSLNSGSSNTVSGTSVTGTVNIPSSWDNLSIRSGPGTSYNIVGSMNQGARCTVYPDKASNGWYYVSYNGVTGYASGSQIIIGSSSGTSNSVSNTRTGVVNIPSSWDNLSIRSGPGTSYNIVGSMNQGARCTVYPDKTSNGWYYVSYNGVTGYASGSQISLQ